MRIDFCFVGIDSPSLPRTTVEPQVQSYCRVLGGALFLMSEVLLVALGTLNHQLSTLYPKRLTLNHKPCTLNPQLSTLNPKP